MLDLSNFILDLSNFTLDLSIFMLGSSNFTLYMSNFTLNMTNFTIVLLSFMLEFSNFTLFRFVRLAKCLIRSDDHHIIQILIIICSIYMILSLFLKIETLPCICQKARFHSEEFSESDDYNRNSLCWTSKASFWK